MHALFVVADIAIYREGLSAFFNAAPDCAVVGATARLLGPVAEDCDAVLIDCSNKTPSDLCGYAALLGEDAPPIVVVGIPDDLNVALAFLEAGAVAYVTRNESLGRLSEVVRATAQDGSCLSQADIPAVLERLRTRQASLTRGRAVTHHDLTLRERQVAQLVVERFSNKEIAARLEISVNTVKSHIHSILGKLGVGRRYEVADVLGLVS